MAKKIVQGWAITTVWGGIVFVCFRKAAAKFLAQNWEESSKRKYKVVPCTIALTSEKD